MTGKSVARRPRSRFSFGIALWVAYMGVTAGPVDARCTQAVPTQDERPPDVPRQWAGLIGEYVRGQDTLSVLEAGGALYVFTTGRPALRVRDKGGDRFECTSTDAAEEDACAFQRNESGFAVSVDRGQSVFKRIFYGQERGASFRITPLKPVVLLRKEALLASPPKESGNFRNADLIELTSLDSTIHLDIRYATTNNFMGEKFYSQAKAFLQRPAAEALVRAHRSLRSRGYGLLIHDAYRPWYVTKMFWDATPKGQKDFVADPAKGSRHNRGCAVDLGLYDLRTGKPVELVSGYDEFSRRAYPDYPGGTSLQRWHRQLLRHTMEAEGFKVFEVEWWHFDFRDWRSYRIGTLKFEELN